MSPRRWLVVSDLDGTLLDHFSYAWDAALPAMERLRAAGIPLILNTSKTRAELQVLRDELGNREPFIVENGSAVFVPRDGCAAPPPGAELRGEFYCRCLGASYEVIRHRLAELRGRFTFEGFGDFDLAALTAHTGLAPDAARRAQAREFSEPLLWRDSDRALAEFRRELAAVGLTTLQGGRFLHVLGDCDKGRSLAWLRACYDGGGRGVGVIALGDSDNDVAMLAAADIAVIVRSPRHAPPAVPGAARVIVSGGQGPVGWNESMHLLLDELAL